MAGVKFEVAGTYSSRTSDFIPDFFYEIRFAHRHVCKRVHVDHRLSLDMFCHRYSSSCNIF